MTLLTSMNNVFLYTICVLIWGSTWLAIKFQLGVVDPEVSVFYRFAIAAVILLCYCRLNRLSLNFSWKIQRFIILQGLLIFAFGYWFNYMGAKYITSGLLAVIGSLIVFMNIVNGAIFLGSAIKITVVLGALLGVMGICLVFWPELRDLGGHAEDVKGVALGALATLFVSLGNIVAARNIDKNLPIIQTTALSMGYGSILMLLIIFVSGKPFHFDTSLLYMGSLFYLAIFGSIIAFACYFVLVGRIGADRASYIGLIVPIIALELSHIYEKYQWSTYSVLGLLLIAIGNYYAMASRSKTKIL